MRARHPRSPSLCFVANFRANSPKYIFGYISRWNERNWSVHLSPSPPPSFHWGLALRKKAIFWRPQSSFSVRKRQTKNIAVLFVPIPILHIIDTNIDLLAKLEFRKFRTTLFWRQSSRNTLERANAIAIEEEEEKKKKRHRPEKRWGRTFRLDVQKQLKWI